jgi:hypothetical protein
MTFGVDTLADVHVAAAPDPLGRPLGTLVVSSTPEGCASLASRALALCTIERVG